MVIEQTTQTVRNVDGESVLDFLVEENLWERELKNFKLKMKHNPKISNLTIRQILLIKP
jgi:hypothetical protein